MKKYLASGGLILSSLIYMLLQQGGVQAQAAGPVASTGNGLPDTAASSAKSGPVFGPSIEKSGPVVATVKPAATVSAKPVATPAHAKGQYTDGSYTGAVSDAYYGNVQVRAIISGGKLTGVEVLQAPNDQSTSRYINTQAMPYLRQEALQVQSASVNAVSGASYSSAAFTESLGSALAQAKA